MVWVLTMIHYPTSKMDDYQKLGLNGQLINQNSPLNEQYDYFSAYNVDSDRINVFRDSVSVIMQGGTTGQSLGTVSSSPFTGDYLTNSDILVGTPGGIYTEIAVGTGQTMNLTFTLNKPAKVLLLMGASGRNNTAAGGFQLVSLFSDNGSGSAPFVQEMPNFRISGANNGTGSTTQYTSVSGQRIIKYPAGVHRIALRYRATGSQQTEITDMFLSYIVLGK